MKVNSSHVISSAASPSDRLRWVGAFTLIELLVVISIIGVLAGLIVGLAPAVTERVRESRLQTELSNLQTAIESYRAKFGIYPPDNFDADKGFSNSGLSPLYYELSGVFVDNANKVFVTADGKYTFSSADVLSAFNRDGFVNAVVQGKRRPFTYRFRESQHASISRTATSTADRAEVLCVGFLADANGNRGSGFAWPTDAKTLAVYPAPVPRNPGLNPWHYVSSNPTNNPGGYDLWAEYFINGERRIIANWKQ
jgi:prepilin-type N-terminal cleavage/methylation domain-containing protein